MPRVRILTLLFFSRNTRYFFLFFFSTFLYSDQLLRELKKKKVKQTFCQMSYNICDQTCRETIVRKTFTRVLCVSITKNKNIVTYFITKFILNFWKMRALTDIGFYILSSFTSGACNGIQTLIKCQYILIYNISDIYFYFLSLKSTFSSMTCFNYLQQKVKQQ